MKTSTTFAIFAGILCAVALAACIPPPPAPSATQNADRCGAAGMQYLVGQNKSVLAAMTFLQGTLRVIEPGMPITRDLRADRLNLEVDSNGTIIRVWCG